MKKINFMWVGIVLSLLVLPLIAAALDIPVTKNNYTTTLNLQVTVPSGGVWNITNVTCYHNMSGSTQGFLAEMINTTASQLNFSKAVDLTALTDGINYNISCLVQNKTGAVTTLNTTLSVSNVTFDSTKPVQTLTLPLSGDFQSYGREIEYRCDSSDAMESATTTALAKVFTVTHPTGDTTTSTTLTTGSNLLKFTDTDYPGDYVFTCTSTDYTGNVQSSTGTVTIDNLGRIVKSSGVTSSSGLDTNKILMIALVIFVLWMIFKKKK